MWIQTKEGILIPIKVVPKAHKNEVVGWENNELKIRIRAVPDKGKANDELIEFLSHHFHVSKSNLQIISGQKSRHKRILAKGLDISKIP